MRCSFQHTFSMYILKRNEWFYFVLCMPFCNFASFYFKFLFYNTFLWFFSTAITCVFVFFHVWILLIFFWHCVCLFEGPTTSATHSGIVMSELNLKKIAPTPTSSWFSGKVSFLKSFFFCHSHQVKDVEWAYLQWKILPALHIVSLPSPSKKREKNSIHDMWILLLPWLLQNA